MIDTNDLVYSEDGQAARYNYLKNYNDINFFVEDTDKEYQYEAILQRMFKGKYNIKNIFTTGGKLTLIERFKEFGAIDEENNRINIYLADGDFDAFLHPNKMISSDNFIYLNAYNIENYYIDKSAVISLMVGIIKKREEDVEHIIEFDDWLNKIINQFKQLFLYYCYIQEYHPSIPNVSRGAARFIDEKTGFEREGAIEDFEKELLEEYSIDLNLEKEKINVIEKHYQIIYGNSYLELICGKFLMFSLYNYLKSKNSKKNIDYNILQWDLIRNFDIHKLNYIKNRVEILYQKSCE